MAAVPETSLDRREDELFQGRSRELDIVSTCAATPLALNRRQVLLFTGVGGIGKSALARRIIRDLRARHEQPGGLLDLPRPGYAAINFAEAWSLDPVQALLQIRLQLGVTLLGARFPIFDFAFARIHQERFPSSEVLETYGLLNPDGALVNRFGSALPEPLRDSEVLQTVADGISELVEETPMLGTALRYLNRVFHKGQEQLDRRTLPLLQEIAEITADRIEGRLPECLGLDIVNALATMDRRPAVLVVADTIEALRGTGAGGIADMHIDAWLRELVWHARGVTFLLLGRDPLDWAKYEHSPIRRWDDIVSSHHLGELADDEVEAILCAWPVEDGVIREVMRSGAAGVPFYLGLQLDIYRDVQTEGMAPALEMFESAPAAVLARFMSHVGADMRASLRTLSHARLFDDELLEFLKAQAGQLVGPQLLSEITRYSFVEGDPQAGFRLHRHFQDIQRDHLARSDPGHQRRIDEALFRYWDARCQPADVRSVAMSHELALAEALHHRALVNDNSVVTWLNERWWVFFEAARLRLLQEAWRTAVDLASNDETQLAVALDNLGLVLNGLDELASARKTHERALAIEEKVYGPESAKVACSLNNLGNVLYRLDDLVSARKSYERALVINEKIYGPYSGEVAQSLNNLAAVLGRLGDLASARKTHERALAINEKVYGPESAEVARSLNNLGDMLDRLDDLAGARKAQERALAILKKVFGPEHADVAHIRSNLGFVLDRLNDFAGALKEQEHAVAILEKVFGPEHTKFARILGNLGNVLEHLDDLAGAQAAQERALAIEEKVYGPEHASVAITNRNLGNVLYRLGDLAGARKVQEHALSILEKVFGPDHTEVAGTLTNLGNVLDRLDDLAGARKAHERALTILEKVHGPEHANIARTLGNLGLVLARLGDLAGARAVQERALAILEKVYGPEHTEVARTLTNLGNVLYRLDEFASARMTHERALAILEKVYGPDHTEVAQIRSNLNIMLQKLNAPTSV